MLSFSLGTNTFQSKNTPSMFDPSSMRDKHSTMGNGKIVGERDYIISFHHFFGFGVLMVLSWRFFDHQIKNFTMRVSGKCVLFLYGFLYFFLSNITDSNHRYNNGEGSVYLSQSVLSLLKEKECMEEIKMNRRCCAVQHLLYLILWLPSVTSVR